MERVSDAGKRVWLRTQRSHVRHVRGARFLAGREQTWAQNYKKKHEKQPLSLLKETLVLNT